MGRRQQQARQQQKQQATDTNDRGLGGVCYAPHLRHSRWCRRAKVAGSGSRNPGPSSRTSRRATLGMHNPAQDTRVLALPCDTCATSDPPSAATRVSRSSASTTDGGGGGTGEGLKLRQCRRQPGGLARQLSCECRGGGHLNKSHQLKESKWTAAQGGRREAVASAQAQLPAPSPATPSGSRVSRCVSRGSALAS